MTVVCESSELGGHQSTTILLIRKTDLAYFRDWRRPGTFVSNTADMASGP